jgi:hypothetical protein
MNDAQLRSLRRTVRRDESISNGAARLFAEIVDLHMMEDGCFAQDTTLAGWLGTTPRTVRRWRRELEETGYLREEPRRKGRHLIPQEAEPDKNVRGDRTKMSGQNCPDRTELSGEPDKNVQEAPDKNVQHREINIPQAGGPERAPAPASGEPNRSWAGEDRLADTVDAITAAVFGEPIRGLTVKDEIRTYCERAGPEGWDCLRSACHLIEEKGWNPTAQLVKKKLKDQLELLRETDELSRNGDAKQRPEENWQRLARAAASA